MQRIESYHSQYSDQKERVHQVFSQFSQLAAFYHISSHYRHSTQHVGMMILLVSKVRRLFTSIRSILIFFLHGLGFQKKQISLAKVKRSAATNIKRRSGHLMQHL